MNSYCKRFTKKFYFCRIYFDRNKWKWTAQIKVRKETKNLGYFWSREEALNKYNFIVANLNKLSIDSINDLLYNIKTMEKVYRRQNLDQALANAGIISLKGAYFWILKRERENRLVCPRDPITGQRKFTQTQIEEIVKEFMPNGKGYWPPQETVTDNSSVSPSTTETQSI